MVCGVVFAGMGAARSGNDRLGAAEATVGFQINSVDVSPLFEFDNQGTDSLADDTLTAGPAQVDLSLDARRQPDSSTPMREFQFDATLTSIEQGALPVTEVYELLFDGTFSFTDGQSGESILVRLSPTRGC